MPETLFSLVFVTAAPFWFLMIVLPAWSWTHRIVSSPLIAAPAAAIYAVLAIPRLGDLLPAVARPTIDSVTELLATPDGTALGWAHFIAFDLFVGRWMYLDARERGIHPVLMAPILLLTILLGPLGFLLYLAVRFLPVGKRRETREAS
ncbi:ABA4-like family protein [Phytomonospora sp. NPDC050363]|uniref:ABA4-like family protein n=1 Tax=Phytomonospora sp. NPDC050363 TaxID=3155642 RepID=UPI003407BB91